mgnify:CR=1 FL=1
MNESHQIDGLNNQITKVEIAGWGYTEFSRSMSDILMTAEASYMSNDECVKTFGKLSKKYPTIRLNITENQLCAKGENKTSS